jgi:16S rRNA (cytosine967-C5)-methyltransferase
VLVDAPCSNTGVLAKRPSARWRFGPATRASLHELQQRLLREAAARVRPGGRLVWSTCSLEPEENSQLVRAFTEAHAGWEIEVEHEALPAAPAPADARGGTPAGPLDGGYRARLRRRG